MDRPQDRGADDITGMTHFSKALRLARVVGPFVQHRGGIRNTLVKVAALYGREGWRGLRRALAAVISGSLLRNDYTEWVRRYDTPDERGRAVLRARAEGLRARPLISVVMPVYNPRPRWLAAAIESVRGQVYPHWELCIADDCSTNPDVHEVLARYRGDDRIRIVARAVNGHISAASNSALELARGEWVILLDHDDILAEHALYWVAAAVQEHPDAQLIYSDEDKISTRGARFSPYFKCDWNPDLFYSHNMFSHLGAYRRELVGAVGGFRVGLEGSQDYDLALRCIERVEPNQIVHIPRVLYHWRLHSQSTAHSIETKPYAVTAGVRALREHLDRRGVHARVEAVACGYRVRYPVPNPEPLVSVIILARNRAEGLRRCVESIVQFTHYAAYEIIVVDNGLDEPAARHDLELLLRDARVRVLRDPRPFNAPALNNAAVAEARGEIVALLHDDVEVIAPDWLSEMVSHALRPGVGAVGALLWRRDESLQHAGLVLGLGGIAAPGHRGLRRGNPGYLGRAALVQSWSAVSGACLVVRRELYRQVGGLEAEHLALAYSDVDLCLKLREAGHRTVWTPYAELFHDEGASPRRPDVADDSQRLARETEWMRDRWGALLRNDPAYSPNLTLDHADFTLAWPPRVEPLSELS